MPHLASRSATPQPIMPSASALALGNMVLALLPLLCREISLLVQSHLGQLWANEEDRKRVTHMDKEYEGGACSRWDDEEDEWIVDDLPEESPWQT